MGTSNRFVTFVRVAVGLLAFFAASHFILTRIHEEPYFSLRSKKKPQISLPVQAWVERISRYRPQAKPKTELAPKAAKKPAEQPQRRSVPPAPAPVVLPVTPVPRPASARTPRIAIVIDDWGYSMRNVEAARSIGLPLTIAVLPNLRYSFTVAQALHERGHEIILHLPMEPQGATPRERDTVLTGHTPDELRRIVAQGLESVTYARGVSNHTGSRATEDEATMRMLLGELRARSLYFLDSYVTVNSLGASLAASIGLPHARRDIFLDNTDDPEYIREQLARLKQKADEQGYAVGIGHDRSTTLAVLGQAMPEMEKEGYEFVYVSDVLN